MKKSEYIYRFQTKKKIIGQIGEPVRNAETAIQYAREKVYNKPADLWREVCTAIYLDSANRIIGHEVVAVGDNRSCSDGKKVIMRTAVGLMAASVIHVHNHPNGQTMPSDKDIEMISELKKSLSAIDIVVLDAIILADRTAFSFAEEKQIKT